MYSKIIDFYLGLLHLYIAIVRSGRIGQHKAIKMKYMLGIRMRKCGLEWGNIIKMQSQ